MNNIQGRVKYDVLDALFRMGSVVHPDVLTTEITSAMERWNNYTRSTLKCKKGSFLSKLFIRKEDKKVRLRIYNKPQDFIRDLKSGYIKDYSEKDKRYIVDLWHKIQDIRCVLEVKSCAKSCQSNNIFADRDCLLALQRVVDNQEEYLKL